MPEIAADTPIADPQSLAAHPDFHRAVLLSAQSSIDLHRDGGLAGWILGDRARALFVHRLLYLDATRSPADPRSGITAARVREFCVHFELCSAGRATAMLALLQTAGYVAAGPGVEDRRVKRLVPTAKLRQLQRERVTRQMEALAHIDPAARASLALIGDPAFERELIIALNDYYATGFRVLDFSPDLRLLAERSGGMLIVFTLLVESARLGSFPLLAPVPLAIADLSRRFRLSRTHILRLLREAEEAGLLERRGETIVASDRLRRAALGFFSGIFTLFSRAAVEALAAYRSRPAA